MQEYPDYKYRPRKKGKVPAPSSNNNNNNNNSSQLNKNAQKAKATKPATAAASHRTSHSAHGRVQKPSAAALAAHNSYTTANKRLQLKLTIDKKFKESIKTSRNVPVAISQYTPPAKVPCSPGSIGDSPGTPESASFYSDNDAAHGSDGSSVGSPPEDKVYTMVPPATVTSSAHVSDHVMNIAPPQCHDPNSLTDLDSVTDLLQLPSNWQLELDNMDLSKLADTDINIDMMPAQPQSHFDFDYSTPEVTELVGNSNDITSLVSLITTQ